MISGHTENLFFVSLYNCKLHTKVKWCRTSPEKTDIVYSS